MKTLTAEQIKKNEERKVKRAKMLFDSKIMPEKKYVGYVSVTGHEYSQRNQMFLAMQKVPFGTLAGFRQWLAAGRSVKKGEIGADILIPMEKKAADETKDDETFFKWTSVFHIDQTEPIKKETI